MIKLVALFFALALAVISFNQDATRDLARAELAKASVQASQELRTLAVSELRPSLDLSRVDASTSLTQGAGASPLAGGLISGLTNEAVVSFLEKAAKARVLGVNGVALSRDTTLCVFDGTQAWVGYALDDEAHTLATAQGSAMTAGEAATLAGRMARSVPLVAVVTRHAQSRLADCQLTSLVSSTPAGWVLNDKVRASVSYASVLLGASDAGAVRAAVNTLADLDALTAVSPRLTANELRFVESEDAMYAFKPAAGSTPARWEKVPVAAEREVVAAPTSCSRSGWLYIPESTLEDGTFVPAFCVSQGEMASYAAYDDRLLPYVEPELYLGNPRGYVITPALSSQAPFGAVRESCRRLNMTLITSNQWQAIANNIAAQPENWTGGVPGGGSIYKGLTGATASMKTATTYTACRTSYPCLQPTPQPWPTSHALDAQGAARAHKLSTGAWIVDFAGNLAEWVDDSKAVDSSTEPLPAMGVTPRAPAAPFTSGVVVADYWGGSAALPADAISAAIAPPSWLKAYGSSQALGLGSYTDTRLAEGTVDPRLRNQWRAAVRGGGVAALARGTGDPVKAEGFEPGGAAGAQLISTGAVWTYGGTFSFAGRVFLEPGIYSYHRVLWAYENPNSYSAFSHGAGAAWRCVGPPQ